MIGAIGHWLLAIGSRSPTRAGRGLLVLVAFMGPYPASGEVNVEVSPRKITVGDPIEVVVTATEEPEARLIFPAPDDFAPAEVLKMDTTRSGAEMTVRYTVSLYKTGNVDLPALPVIYNRAGSADTVRVSPGSVTVESVLDPADSTADIRDIKPPVKLAWTFKELLPYIIGGILLAALAVVGYLFWRKYRRKGGGEIKWRPRRNRRTSVPWSGSRICACGVCGKTAT